MLQFGASQSETLPLQWGVVIGASLVAAAVDLSSRRIPNWLTLPVFLTGLAIGAIRGGPGGLAESFGSAVLLALPFLILFVFAGGGAGDAKLMGAIGAWLGFRSGLVTLAAVCTAGIVCAIAYSLARRRLAVLVTNLKGLVQGFALVALSRGRFRDAAALVPGPEKMQAFPYGLAIFLGVFTSAMGANL
jgi:prepilin peptidase CpaA